MRFHVSAPLLVLALSSPLLAVFNPGSINGQEGWSGGGAGGSVSANVDQNLVENDGNFANGAFRVSNSTVNGGGHNGSFGGWVFSPTLGATVGQPGSGAGADSMSVSFYFKSAAGIADGSNMEFDIVNVLGTGRNIFFAITNDTDGPLDADKGLKFRTQEPNGTLGTFNSVAVSANANNLARGTWHQVEIIMTTIAGGPSNDTFDVKLNTVTVLSAIRTFEDWNTGLSQPYTISDGLMMRSGIAAASVGAFSNTAPQGYLVDDLMIRAFNASAPGVTLASYSTDFTVVPVPEPATWAVLAGIGALGFALARRRRA